MYSQFVAVILYIRFARLQNTSCNLRELLCYIQYPGKRWKKRRTCVCRVFERGLKASHLSPIIPNWHHSSLAHHKDIYAIRKMFMYLFDLCSTSSLRLQKHGRKARKTGGMCMHFGHLEQRKKWNIRTIMFLYSWTSLGRSSIARPEGAKTPHNGLMDSPLQSPVAMENLPTYHVCYSQILS